MRRPALAAALLALALPSLAAAQSAPSGVTGSLSIAGGAEQVGEIAAPGRMRKAVDARPDAPVNVLLAGDQRAHRFRVSALLAHRRTVLAIAGDVEYGSALALQSKRFANVAVVAGVVHAGG